MSRKTAVTSICLLFAIRASAITYLNAASTAATPDGAGWATAYTDVKAAVTAALAGDGVVYAAQGVYPLTSGIALSKRLEFYGGFPGVSDAETIDDRDADLHQTIVLGARASTTDYWSHLVPSEMPCGAPTVTVTETPVISNGKITLPMDFEGDYDGYFNPCATTRDNITPFDCNGHGHVFDGIWFTGFKTSSGRSIVRLRGNQSSDGLVNNCRFVGNAMWSGCVGGSYATSRETVTNCLFYGNTQYGGTSECMGVSICGPTNVVADCRFVSCMAPNATTAGSVAMLAVADAKGLGALLTKCVFTRNYMRSSGVAGPLAVGTCPALLVWDYTTHGRLPVTQCVMTNNLAVTDGTFAVPLVISTQSIRLLQTVFAHNRMETKVAAGGGCAMVTTQRGRNSNYPCMLVDGTLFKSNSLVAVLADDPGEGECHAAIVGNSAPGVSYFSVLDSVFDGNSVEVETSGTVSAVRSRGFGLHSDTSSYTVQGGIGNCTFLGPAEEGLYDVFQTGSAQSTLAIVNSIFTTDGYIADPIYATDPSKFRLHCNTIKNWTSAETYATQSGTATDDIPLDRETYAPTARLEGIRTTCDMAYFSTTYNLVGQYRLPGTSSWVAMIDYYGTSSSGTLAKDIREAPRTAGSFTRGAVQTMSPAAEDPTARLLLLRCTPVTAGRVEPGTQMVADGGSSTSLTAVPADDCSFAGWYLDGSETPLSTSATLQPIAINDDATLVAAFSAAASSVTFDLGAAGTFVGNGLSNMVISAAQGSALALPEFVENDLFHVYSWSPEVPALVPAGNAVYRAQYVTKDVRSCTVAPGDDLQAAIDDMGIWRGEVHFTPGIYTISSTLHPVSNVRLVADGAGVVLTGDTAGDDYWLPDGADPGAGNRTAIWNAGLFNEPNPAMTNDYWKAKFNGVNCPAAISQASGTTVTNFIVEGLVFTCFSDTAVNLLATSRVAVRDCAFLANYNAVVSTGGIAIDGGRITGNSHSTRTYPDTSVADAVTNVISGVTYSDNYSNEGGWYVVATQGKTIFTNCVFRRNCCGGSGTLSIFYIYDNKSLWRAIDCLFEENIALGNSYGLIYPSGSPQFVRCRFIGNRNKGITAADHHAAVFFMRSSDSVLVRDSLFLGNAVEGSIAASTTTSAVASVVSLFEGNDKITTAITFVNTTFLRNTVSVSDASGLAVAGTFATRLASGRVLLVHCSVSGSEITCEGGAAAGDLAAPPGLVWAPRIANSAVWSEGCPGVAGGAAPILAGGVVKGLGGANPGLGTTLRTAGGLLVPQIPVGAASEYTRSGHPVYGTSSFYLHAPSVNPDYPWWNILNNDWYTEARARSSLGLDRLPRLPDAWGRERVDGRISVGPLNVKPGSTTLMLR